MTHAAGQAATERSLTLLLEQDFEVRVLALPPVGNKKADPDLFIREKGAEEYLKLLKEAPPYVDYLIARARQMDLGNAHCAAASPGRTGVAGGIRQGRERAA
jgi:DNA primase